ncbi:MAG: STAS domain-containing protein [Burkholderiales bacterium]|nr:STAS domain-containing protein [Burkholderiales bacterium]
MSSLQLPATATLAEASTLARSAEQAVMQGVAPGGERAPLAIDASALHSFDTSVLAVLLHARRLALGAGCAFELGGAPDKLAQLAALYGVAELLGLTPPSANSTPVRSAAA